LRLAKAGTVKLTAKVAARLAENPDAAMHSQKAPPNASASRRGDGRFRCQLPASVLEHRASENR
jgi:hypothetical protein